MKNNGKYYPLKFIPIFKERIWGGQKLATELNKPIPTGKIGESWELSAVENDVSIISEGEFKGRSLVELIEGDAPAILGSRIVNRFGKQFPLLFKFIDAREDLSIQVHPDDELAGKRHDSLGKTEMWYVLQADQDLKITVGFSKDSSAEKYKKALDEKKLPAILNSEKAAAGDCYFLETGTIHAIGAGILLAEIQQTSDITYRVYDWDRIDENGKSRELHTELALDAINFKKTSSKIQYAAHVNKATPLVQCPYFNTSLIALDGTFRFDKIGDAFTVLMCVSGNFKIVVDGVEFDAKFGETVLIPAVLKGFEIKGTASVLEIYIS